MLCNVKRPDDVTTDESNPVGFRFATPNRFESIISSSSEPCEQGAYLDDVKVDAALEMGIEPNPNSNQTEPNPRSHRTRTEPEPRELRTWFRR